MSFLDTIDSIVGAIMERRGYHYLALREYRVSSQNADGTLELEAMGANKPGKAPGLSNVRIMQIGPGSSIKPGPKSTVLVGFKNGNPDERYALGLWSGSQANQMIIECLDLQLGGQATDFAIKGTTYRNAEVAMHTPIISALTTLQGIAVAVDLASAILLVNGCKVALVAILTAMSAFEAKAATFLATNVKVK